MLQNSKYSQWGYIKKQNKTTKKQTNKGRESCFFLMDNEPTVSDVDLKGDKSTIKMIQKNLIPN